jgi:DNA repair protein RadC
LPADPLARRECPRCGYEASNDDGPPLNFYRPWHLRGKDAVKAYVESLGVAADEWLLALYVNRNLDLIAVDTVARGNVSGVTVPIGRLLYRGHQLAAEGFILVHNHPSGDPTPGSEDVRITVRLAKVSRDCDLPLLCHYIVVASGEMRTVGEW